MSWCAVHTRTHAHARSPSSSERQVVFVGKVSEGHEMDEIEWPQHIIGHLVPLLEMQWPGNILSPPGKYHHGERSTKLEILLNCFRFTRIGRLNKKAQQGRNYPWPWQNWQQFRAEKYFKARTSASRLWGS